MDVNLSQVEQKTLVGKGKPMWTKSQRRKFALS